MINSEREHNVLYPIKYKTFSAATGPVPVAWGGWITFSAAVGSQWIEIHLY